MINENIVLTGGQRIKHERTGQMYTIIQATLLMKIAEGEWTRGVAYSRTSGLTDVFVRDEECFRKNFSVSF